MCQCEKEKQFLKFVIRTEIAVKLMKSILNVSFY